MQQVRYLFFWSNWQTIPHKYNEGEVTYVHNILVAYWHIKKYKRLLKINHLCIFELF